MEIANALAIPLFRVRSDLGGVRNRTIQPMVDILYPLGFNVAGDRQLCGPGADG